MKPATARWTAPTPKPVPIRGSVSSESAIPAGHELTKIAIVVAISWPTNQSATIFVICTLSMTPPAPLTNLNMSSAGWSGANRCNATGGLVMQVPMPSSYVVPNSTQNNSAAILLAEYVGIATAFYGGTEPQLMNGVLDRIARTLRPYEFGVTGGGQIPAGVAGGFPGKRS